MAGCAFANPNIVDDYSTMIAGFYVLPIDDFFTLGPYEVLLLRGQDAQRVLLTCPGLAVDDVRTLVHIDCTLGKRAGLKRHREKVGSGKLTDVLANPSTWSAFSHNPPQHEILCQAWHAAH